MTISFGAIGAKSAGGTTTISVAYPSGIATGSIAITGRCVYLDGTSTAIAEAGWKQAANLQGGTGTAADAHTGRVAIDYKILDGTESGSVTFDQGGTLSGALGVMARYAQTAGYTWDVVGVTGDDATHGADRSVTASSSVSLQPGDLVVAVAAVDTDTDLAAFSSPAITATSITFGTTTRRTSGAGVITGNDGNVELFDATVTSGTATSAPVLTFTTSTTQCGPVAFVRLRELLQVAPTKRQTFDNAAADGTTVDASNSANSGDAIVVNTTTGGGDLQYETASKIRGTKGGQALGPTGTDVKNVALSDSNSNQASGQMYFRVDTARTPGTASWVIARFRNTTTNSTICVLTTGRVFQLQNTSGTALKNFQSNTALADGTYYLQMQTQHGAGTTDGMIACQLFNASNDTLVDLYWAPDVAAGTTNINQFQFGKAVGSGTIDADIDEPAFSTGTLAPLGTVADKTLTDTGSGADSLSVTATVPLADTGAGADSLSASATVPLADTGTGVDALSIDIISPDSIQATPQIPWFFVNPWLNAASLRYGANEFIPTLSDQGTATDALSVTATVPLAETGSGADAMTVVVPISLADTGSGADAMSVTATVALSETGTAVDVLSVTATVTLSDTGSAAEAIGAGVPISLSDTGSGADVLTITSVSVTLTDIGTAAEATTFTATVPLAGDTGTGADFLALTIPKTLTDTGTGSDALTVAAMVALADAASAVELISSPDFPSAIPFDDSRIFTGHPMFQAFTGTDARQVATGTQMSQAVTGTDARRISTGTQMSRIVSSQGE